MGFSNRAIIEMGPWLQTAAGQYVAAWLQEQLDLSVADAFGFHAVQLGLPEINGLRANRMPHRWCIEDLDCAATDAPPDCGSDSLAWTRSLVSEFQCLPLPANSVDLVVLPYTLEMSVDPHATLAEVARVLMPEGRVVIAGFNPMSLWGLRQWLGWSERLGRNFPPGDKMAPHPSEFLGYRRVRDWLRLLSFEVEGGRFGLWRPPAATQTGLERLAWMDRVGSYWWPVLGGMYVIEAVKRVRGMRLVGIKPQTARRPSPSPAVIATPSATRKTTERLEELVP